MNSLIPNPLKSNFFAIFINQNFEKVLIFQMPDFYIERKKKIIGVNFIRTEFYLDPGCFFEGWFRILCFLIVDSISGYLEGQDPGGLQPDPQPWVHTCQLLGLDRKYAHLLCCDNSSRNYSGPAIDDTVYRWNIVSCHR